MFPEKVISGSPRKLCAIDMSEKYNSEEFVLRLIVVKNIFLISQLHKYVNGTLVHTLLLETVWVSKIKEFQQTFFSVFTTLQIICLSVKYQFSIKQTILHCNFANL